MSPSRGILIRFLNIGKGLHPFQRYVRPRYSNNQFRSSHHSQGFTLSLPSYNQIFDARVPVNSDSITRESNKHLHPDGIDSALFEPTCGEYQDTLLEVDAKVAIWHTDSSELLDKLIAKSIKDATTTLGELKNLQSKVEPRIEFARPARNCAIEEDYQGCLSWIDVLPNFYNLEQPVIMSEEYDSGCQDIAHTLNLLTNSRAEPYLICLTLLKIVGKGFLEAGEPVNKAIHRTMKWLVRHGKVLNDEDAHAWTWQLWQSVSKFAARAKLEAFSEITENLDTGYDDELEYELTRLYNGCLRTICLTGNFEAAIIWVKNSCYLQSVKISRGTRLQSFTWKVFLEEILDRSSNASATLRNQVGALVREMQKKAELAPEVENLQILAKVTGKFNIDRNAELMSVEANLDEKVKIVLDEGDRMGAISFLLEALLEDEKKSKCSHLPKASTLTALREEILEKGNLGEKEVLDAYLKALTSSKGGKGLVPLTEMLRLSNNEQHAECVSLCLTRFQCRELEEFALLVDREKFSEDLISAKATDKYRENKYASYLALKSLLYLCHNDFTKIDKIYQNWLEMISHHRRDLKVEEKTAKSPADEDVFEQVDSEYLFISNTDTYNQEAAAKIGHKTPPNSRPSIYYFNLFLKVLPKAMGIHDESTNKTSQKTRSKASDCREEAIKLAFKIIEEMQQYQVEPNASTWSILLSFLARNISMIPMQASSVSNISEQDNNGQAAIIGDELSSLTKERQRWKQMNENQWNRIWSLTSALGMGPNHLRSPSSPLPRATALTYSSLIDAFLKVPPSRGGPCLDEASQVKKWLLEDRQALQDVKKYRKPVNRVLRLLETVKKRRHENKLGKKRAMLNTSTVSPPLQTIPSDTTNSTL